MTLEQLQSIENEKQIQSLHAEYCRLVNITMPLSPTDYHRRTEWLEFRKMAERRGLTADNALRLLVRYIQEGIKKEQRNQGALKFRNLIGRIDYSEEDLATAMAEDKARKGQGDPNRAAALRATGRPSDAKEQEAQAIGQVLKRMPTTVVGPDGLGPMPGTPEYAEWKRKTLS